jgi:hypothetical protein
MTLDTRTLTVRFSGEIYDSIIEISPLSAAILQLCSHAR